MGAIAHLTLQAMESYSALYNKVNDMVMWSIGQPNADNPEWTGEDDTVHNQYVYSEVQNRYYEHFQNIQREFQVDLRNERPCLYKGLNDLVLTTFSFFLTPRLGQTWPVSIETEFLKQHNTVSNYSLPNLP